MTEFVIGEIRKGRDIGRQGGSAALIFIWCACSDCGKTRWVKLRHGKATNKRCLACYITHVRRDVGADNKDKPPFVGELRKGRYIEMYSKYPTANFIFRACVDCGKLGWVRYVSTTGSPKSLRCQECSGRANGHAHHDARNVKNTGVENKDKPPVVGEIRKGRYIDGLHNRSKDNFIYRSCRVCGKLEWAVCIKGKLQSSCCLKCCGFAHGASTRKNIGIENKDKQPVAGEIRLGRFIDGHAGQPSERFIYQPCVDCGRLEWVSLDCGKPHSLRCQTCANREMHARPEIKARMHEAISALWSNPEYAERVIRASMLGLHIKPNKPEQLLLTILNKVDPDKWKFIGDGKTEIENNKHSIGGKFPDFWDGDHKLVEFFGDYWHRGEDPQERINLFSRYGYKCLVIWEHELKQPEQVVGCIAEFVGVD